MSVVKLAGRLPGSTVDVFSEARVSSSGELLTVPSSAVLSSKVDSASQTVTYVGKAAPGALGSAAVWQIQRLTQSGNVLSTEWADGDTSFNNVWDNRASLAYS